MRKPRHLSDEEIIRLIDNPAPSTVTQKRATQIAHFDVCHTCAERYDAYSRFISVLTHAAVWNREPLPDAAPDESRYRRIAQLFGQVRHERAGVEPAIETALTGQPGTWKENLVAIGNIYTYGMVDVLLDRAVALTGSSPEGSLQLTLVAVEIADQLPVDAYPFDFVVALRARACREHAFSLYYVGRLPEALPFVDRAGQLFRQTPRPEFDLARVDVMRALIYRDTSRLEAAIPLAHEAAETFLFYGDRPRYINTRMTEATMLFRQRRHAEAAMIWRALEDETSVKEQPTYGMLLQHLGSSYRELGDFDRARDYYARAIAEHQKRNAVTDILHVQWSLALTLMAEQKQREALAVLREAWRGLAELRMLADGALVGLKVAEVLLMLHEPAEVPAICRTLLDQFTRSGMTSPAISALSYLREAVAMGKATPALVSQIHDFIQDLPKHPARAFTPPPL